ncbi:MAG: hypothetical protein Q8Q88_19735 [Phenylobacterium sp.]|nr:hypothetical protein [Phenylobacterium sp.]MDP3749274.1 hypothetical protein [Phenylobacterium sp.]
MTYETELDVAELIDLGEVSEATEGSPQEVDSEVNIKRPAG